MSSIFIRRANIVCGSSPEPTPGRLPAGYTELAYLGSDGNAFLNSDIAGGKDTLEIECKFEYSIFVQYGAVYGNYAANTNNGTRLILYVTTDNVIVNNNTMCKSGGNTYLTCASGVVHTIVSAHSSITLDGTTTSQGSTQGSANNNKIAIFNNKPTAPASPIDIGLKIYYFTIKDNGTLVFDGVPAMRNADSVVGMYNLVNNAFLTNAGSGSFSYG